MILDKNSTFVKWIFFLNNRVPAQMNLCPLFWQMVFALTIQPFFVALCYLFMWLTDYIVAPIAFKVRDGVRGAVDWLDNKINTKYDQRRAEQHANYMAAINGDISLEEYYRRRNEIRLKYSRWARLGAWNTNLVYNVVDSPFWAILGGWLVSFKTKMCPVVRFVDPKEPKA